MKYVFVSASLWLFVTGCATSHEDHQTAEPVDPISESDRLEVLPASLAIPRDHLESVRVLDISGMTVHEADSKQPRFVRGVMADVIERAKLKQVEAHDLREWLISGKELPLRIKPADGFSGAIGSETYLRSVRQAASGSPKGSDNPESLASLKSLLQLLSGQLSGVGKPATEHLLKQFLLERAGSQTGTLSNVQFPGGIEELLRNAGYWTRPEMSNRELRQKNIAADSLYTLGEQSLSRNRALLILQILEKTGRSLAELSELKKALQNLDSVKGSEDLLWARTHLIIEPTKGSDLALSLGRFSALMYTFAMIDDVTDTDFELQLLSYVFAYGEPYWNQDDSRQIVSTMCSSDAQTNLASEENCEKLMAIYDELGEPSFDVFEKYGLASALSVSGYSPVMLSTERVKLSDLTPGLVDSLRKALQL